MVLQDDPQLWINAASGLLLVALGVFMALLRPRRGAKTAFAIFCMAFGGRVVLAYANTIVQEPRFQEQVLVPAMLLSVVATVALPIFSLWFPRRLRAQERRLLVVPFLGVIVYLAAHALAVGRLFSSSVELYEPLVGSAAAEISVVEFAVAFVVAAAFHFALLLMALRYATAQGASMAADRRQYVFMSFALLLWTGMAAGGALLPEGFFGRIDGLVGLFLLGVLCLLWIRNTHRHSGPAARGARNLALACLALPLLGLVFTLLQPGLRSLTGPQYGVARTLSVLLVAYAILRHQLFGLDLTLKWTISRGTVAAIVLGAFFVVTALAENYVERYGWVAGGVVTGILLFAIHPLQRLGQGVANAALPGVKSVDDMSRDERLLVYRDAAVQAWADGSLDRSERAILDRLRESLHLSLADTVRIEGDAVRGEGAG